jgi:hypothetical protein
MDTLESTHPDVEFHVTGRGSDITQIVHTWDDARGILEGSDGTIDVCVWSKKGARWYGGDDAVASYKEDPDASVFERWEVRNGELANCVGRVP